MKAEIQREPDYVLEAKELLCMLAEDVSGEKIEKRMIEKARREEMWRPVVTVIGKILKKAEKYFAKEMNVVREYFTPMMLQDNYILNLADLALMYNGQCETFSLEQRKEELKTAGEEWISSKAMEVLGLDVAEISELPGRHASVTQIISVLEESSLTREQKWKSIQVAVNPLEHLKKIEPLLKEAEKIFKGFEKEWKPLEEEMVRNWTAYLEERDIRDILKECLGAEIEENINGVVVVPEIMNYAKIEYRADVRQQNKTVQRDIFRLGYLFCTMENFAFLTNPANRQKDAKEYLLQMMKCFSDKSKLEILLLLKEKEMYGSELADALGLTTATISHHMNVLLIQQLVSVEQKGNRAYYRLNREEILRTLKAITELW